VGGGGGGALSGWSGERVALALGAAAAAGAAHPEAYARAILLREDRAAVRPARPKAQRLPREPDPPGPLPRGWDGADPPAHPAAYPPEEVARLQAEHARAEREDLARLRAAEDASARVLTPEEVGRMTAPPAPDIPPAPTPENLTRLRDALAGMRARRF
jgi:hypothetical protein